MRVADRGARRRLRTAVAQPRPDRLFRNRGDGTFAGGTVEAGLQAKAIRTATAEQQTAWLETLNATLARYREGQPARTLWPPHVRRPGMVEPP